MEQAVRRQNKRIKTFCKACFTGIYPTGDVSPQTLKMIEEERDHNRLRSQKIN
jgi:glutamine phosphoribosylpyrophosphate amidotransferase